MKVEAYQCKYCEQVYLDELGMEYCENSCRMEREKELKQAEFKKQQKDLQESVRLESVSVEDICRRCIEVQNKFAAQDGTPKLIDMKLDVRYHSNASNSHSSPMSEVSNFSRKPELPTGYPALVGRVRFKYECSHNYLKRIGSDILRFINTGTGGGSVFNQGYDVTLWLDDFPLIKRQVEECLQEQKRLELLTDEIETSYKKQIENDGVIQSLNEDLKTVKEKIYQLQKVEGEIYQQLQKDKRVYIDFCKNEYKDQCSKLKDNTFGIQVPYLSL